MRASCFSRRGFNLMMIFWGLLNLSFHMAHKGPRRNRYQQPMGMVKKACPREGGGSALSPAQTQGRQDALFHRQGRSQFGARSVFTVGERERREERQVCEPAGQAKGRERRWRLFSTFPFWFCQNRGTFIFAQLRLQIP